MSNRFDIRDLIVDTGRGLTNRVPSGVGRPDWVAWVVLVGPALAAALAFGWSPRVLRSPDETIAGTALLAGATLAVFVQLASWRGRYAERDDPSDKMFSDAVDEAAGLCLLSSLAAVFLTVALVLLANVKADASSFAQRGLSSLAVAVGVFLCTAFVLVIVLLWDAYRAASGSFTRAKASDLR